MGWEIVVVNRHDLLIYHSVCWDQVRCRFVESVCEFLCVESGMAMGFIWGVQRLVQPAHEEVCTWKTCLPQETAQLWWNLDVWSIALLYNDSWVLELYKYSYVRDLLSMNKVPLMFQPCIELVRPILPHAGNSEIRCFVLTISQVYGLSGAWKLTTLKRVFTIVKYLL